MFHDHYSVIRLRISPCQFINLLLSITRGVLAQSPEPKAHDKVLDNNPDRIGIWKFGEIWKSGQRHGSTTKNVGRTKSDF